MTKSSKHRLLVIFTLSITLSVFHTANAADKPASSASKSRPAKDQPVEIKTYTMNGHADATPAAAAKSVAATKPIPPQLLARRFGPGQVGLNGRPWNPAMALGVGPLRR